MVLSDIDRLFKVNRVANALDIVGEFNFFSSTATEAIAKIEKLSKLVASANLSIKVIFSQKPSRKKSLKGGGWPWSMPWPSWIKKPTMHISLSLRWRQSFPTPSTHSTFANFDHKNYNRKPRDYSKDYNSKPRDYSKDNNSKPRDYFKDRSRDKYRYKSPNSSFNRNRWGSGSRTDRSTSWSRCGHNDSGSNWSGQTSVSFHTNSPNGFKCIIDTGAQRSCIGERAFINLGGNPDNLSKSTHSYIFGDGKPYPSIGKTKKVLGNHEFSMDVVSWDVPRLIGMDILDHKKILIVLRKRSTGNEEACWSCAKSKKSFQIYFNKITLSSSVVCLFEGWRKNERIRQ